MAERQGGYRKPNKPAPVSGPASLSKRTDDGRKQAVRYMAGGQYGEGKRILEQQQGAPMAGKPQVTPGLRSRQLSADQPITPLFAPTRSPEEPLTTGIDVGPGMGSEILQQRPSAPTLFDVLNQLMENDVTGDAELLYNYLSSQGY